MKQAASSREVFARQDSLGEDFALLFEAFADAFRGLPVVAPANCSCIPVHYAGWR